MGYNNDNILIQKCRCPAGRKRNKRGPFYKVSGAYDHNGQVVFNQHPRILSINQLTALIEKTPNRLISYLDDSEQEIMSTKKEINKHRESKRLLLELMLAKLHFSGLPN